MSASTPSPGLSHSSTEVLAATIAGAVERQLTQYVGAMAKQVEAARQAVESSRAELRAEFQQQIKDVLAQFAAAQTGAEGQQHALQTALEARLADFSSHQQARLNEVENRLFEMPAGQFGGSAVDSGELIALREHIDAQSAGAHSRIDELNKATRRFDEQAAAMVQHVNDTTVALTQRIDESNQALAGAVEERLGFVRTTLEAVGPEVQRQLSEHAVVMAQRVDFAEHKVTDRMLAMEERVNEQNGSKIARLEATIGRIGSGFDEAIAALSQRMLGLDNQLHDSIQRIDALTEQISQVDNKAIAAVREQLSAAVGEAMLVRIELDRVVANTDDKIGKTSLRMAEIEALLSDEMDVNAAVQLERLDELERALTALDPEQFVRRTDPGAGGAPPTASRPAAPSVTLTPVAGIPSTSLNPTLPSSTSTSEPSLSSF